MFGVCAAARFTGMYYSQLKAHTYEELIGIVLGPRFYKLTVLYSLCFLIMIVCQSLSLTRAFID